MEIDWERIQNWIGHFGLDIAATHVSGHAAGNQLKELIDQVNPKTIIPINTENAKVYKKWSSNVYLLEKAGATFNLPYS